MVEKMGYRYDTELTPQYARIWTETSPNSKLNNINRKLDSLKGNNVDNLKNLIQKREYVKFQKEIGFSAKKDLDGKLGGRTLDQLEAYLEKLDGIEANQQDTKEQLDSFSLSIAEKKENLHNNAQNNSNNAMNSINGVSAQNDRVTLSSLGKGKQSPKERIFHEWPKLNTLGKNLLFDPSSRLDSIKPHLNDLSNLPAPVLSKISNTVNYICISDKTVTNWSTNKDLLGITPRGYTNSGKTWGYVGGCYRDGNVYVGRSRDIRGNYYRYEQECSSNINGTDSIVLHEIGHAFDDKYRISTSSEFKSFHRAFYNRIGSYFQQGGPGGRDGCSEFFAEATAEFHKWGRENFTKYYNQEFYNYMEKILS